MKMNKKRVVLIIQARMGSSRLPGKSLMDLAGAPLIGRILERVKRTKKLNDIVLAVPDTPEDMILKRLGESYGVKVFAGAENDLLERYYQAAVWSGAELVGRLPADNATPEPAEIDRIVDFHQSFDPPGFSSNLAAINHSGYPDGIGAEIFDFSLLEEARIKNKSPHQREHVHLNFFDYSNGRAADESWCPVRTIKCPKEFRRPDIVLDINTPKQYEFIRALYEYLYPNNPEFHITDIIKWYDNVYMKSETEGV
jgi:spore coat polysaccharide biosynthesis protein SpsF